MHLNAQFCAAASKPVPTLYFAPKEMGIHPGSEIGMSTTVTNSVSTTVWVAVLVTVATVVVDCTVAVLVIVVVG